MTFNILFYYGTVRYSILAIKKGSEKVVGLPLQARWNPKGDA
jgi:hypothetical protein